eukprot:TRINITY_DN2613_c1_g1_i5.p1 TRINITY_DN2613_c1_g1~~TRINITY_DN2613_c1_g1_i5.p1  ORF type:complete len:277 (+),score=15.33 TRINITY_DN2613_c1_g1_i5:76-906(+)
MYHLPQNVWKLIITCLEPVDVKSLSWVSTWFRIFIISASLTDKQSLSLHANVKKRLLDDTKETRQRFGHTLLELVATGKHGVVYRGFVNNKKSAVKMVNKQGITLEREVIGLKAVNALGLGPTLYFTDEDDVVVMEWVDGVLFTDFITSAVPTKVLWAVRELVTQCDAMDNINLVKSEMTHPGHHIIVRPNPLKESGCDLVMLDYDRSVLFTEPSKQSRRNVSQVIQYICTPRISGLLGERGIAVDIAQTRNAARDYKLSPSRGTLHSILQCFTLE